MSLTQAAAPVLSGFFVVGHRLLLSVTTPACQNPAVLGVQFWLETVQRLRLTLPLHLGQQLLASDRCDHAAAAALVAGSGPEWAAARDRALASAMRTIMKLGMNFTFTWHAGPALRCGYAGNA